MSSEQFNQDACRDQQRQEDRLSNSSSDNKLVNNIANGTTTTSGKDSDKNKDPTDFSLNGSTKSGTLEWAQAAATTTRPEVLPTASSLAPTRHSRIVDFYSGRSILVTGASGFLGKLLIEKLLRSCSSLKQIYVLIRPRRNKSASERFSELFDSIMFSTLKAQFSDISGSNNQQLLSNQNEATAAATSDSETAFKRFLSDKITLLEGDLTKPLLGLSKQQVETLASKVSVVLHSAAIVSFDGKLRRSIKTNLTGTYQVLEVACKLPKLVSFVHVSTCYSNCTLSKIDEHIYPVNVDPMNVIDMAEFFDDELIEPLRERLLGSHPNPYTYTKQLCEHLCGQYAVGKGLPVLICRPSIVVSTLEEPLRGFVDNRNGTNGLHDGVARGLLRVAPGRNTALADMVPADLVVNCIIALGWFAHAYHRVRYELEPEVAATTLPMNEAKQSLDRVNEDVADADAELVRLKMINYYRIRKARLAKKFESGPEKFEEAAPAATGMPGLKANRSDTIATTVEQLCQVPVVHVSSGMENPITFKKMCNYVAEGARKYPSRALFREPSFTLIPVGLRYKLWRFYQHTLVAALIDLLARLLVAAGPNSKKPAPTPSPTPVAGAGKARANSGYWTKQFERLDRFVGVLPYFLSNSWYFNPESKLVLVGQFMTEEDRRLFNCNSAVRIDWRAFGHEIAHGMRKYIYEESDETLEVARAKYNRTYWRNILVQAALTVVLGCMAYFGLYRNVFY